MPGSLKYLLLCGILLLPLASRAQPRWHVESASITFTIKNAGLPVGGSFEGLEADLRFDPAQPERSTMVASIDASTVRTGIGLRDRHLRKRDYFDVERHPRIRMTCMRIEKAQDGVFRGRFRLQIKEFTQEVTMPFTFTFTAHGRGGRLVGDFTLNRLDFGLGEQSLILADVVTVRLAVDVKPAE